MASGPPMSGLLGATIPCDRLPQPNACGLTLLTYSAAALFNAAHGACCGPAHATLLRQQPLRLAYTPHAGLVALAHVALLT
ncbi:hypothetical protein NDU88_008540 [Pleurodeles waltl]|uniref:Uncharacterized protein n=1 Tax=Pleurodeles waltl TaxID=8319 RepID=A0AAV7PQN9_PLEWA|nr:hypothetical protein NDU88_008540 [Pleurodeles waltl]